MKTNRLTKKMVALLNQQVTNEAKAAQLYLFLAVWVEGEAFSGLSQLLFHHSGEERGHMMKVIQYIMSRGGAAQIEALAAPKAKPDGLSSCLERIYTHERENSKAINGIASLALDEQDWPTWNFAQWLVKEQIEEENLALKLLDNYHLATKGKSSGEIDYLLFDRQIAGMKDEADLAREATF